MIVPRTCTEVSAGDADQHQEKEPRPLEAFRDAPAYVLLGDPGAGKTTAFEAECEALGEKAYFRVITADEFLTYDVSDLPPEWQEKTLFIDGLDEVRAGAQGESAFREIRKLLRALSKPRFRLSCRQADWLGTYDQERLESVSPDSKVTALRLDPLTDSDVEKILNARADIPDAHAFITIAKEKGVDGLLANPLSLDMLAKAVAGGRNWPESRKETFEMACREIVDGHHEGRKELLDAAGRLCAVQLISGTAGYTLRGQSDEDYPAPDQCDSGSLEMLRYALATKLFKGTSDNRFAPVHRHIAEFLGARYLAGVIKSGLPARRVISLIAGEDGTVVTEMRGLSAWLAAHSKDARADLIERDPIGVGLYGDIREFSTENKYALMESLSREAARLDSVWSMTAAFGALATPDMESEIKERLSDSGRDRGHQIFIGFVLDVLREGSPLPNLSDILLEIVRDDKWWPGVNYTALNAFIHNCPDSPKKTDKFKALLADILSGSLSDADNELLGTLLAQLYPQELPPSEVWDCLSEKGNTEFFGSYWRFWDTELLKKSSDEQVVELLDNLQQRLPCLESALDVRHLNKLPLKLLAHGLKAHGDQLDTEHLYDWLSVRSERMRNSLNDQAIQEIRSWLERRPKIHKAIFMEGLSRCPESDEFRRHAIKVQNRLYGASSPPDFGPWCLKQADALADTKPLIAEYLLGRAFNEGLSREVLQEYTQRNETLKVYLDRLLDSIAEATEFEEQWQQEEQQQEQERQQQQEQWLAYIRSNKDALCENRAEPALLYKLAQVYFGHFDDFSGTDGPEIVAKMLRGDCGLINATLRSFRGAVDREDVPDVKEILSLRKKRYRHNLGLPFLAGLAELERIAPEEDPSRWSDDRIRRAIAFCYCTSHADYRPGWYRRLITARPKIVAEVQVQFAICEFRSGREHIYKLVELAHDTDHDQVAKYASLPLLRAFPTRCKQKQIEGLDHLLWAAIQHADRASLEELIRRKLSRSSMNVAQRVHWLAAGIIVSPETYNASLSEFVQVRESRIRYLVAFFDSRVQFSFDVLGTPGLELLIRLIGDYAGPDQWWNEEGLVTPAMQASRLVNGLIQRLAASPTKDASDALGRLLADSSLSRWRDVLSQAQDTQRVTWRDASYRHPTIEQVCQTLNGGTPANPGDLAALVMDRLRELADQIRRGNTDDWRQYWNEPHEQLPAPKHEDHCRDALLSDLRQHLPQEVDAQPEGQYANDKRADMRVSYEDFQVPVEIKKSMHRDLWSACKNQLIKLYTSAPDTDGYGIYLVFWFGKEHTQASEEGRPSNSEELKKRLYATLSLNEARKISVCVIDVSRPN